MLVMSFQKECISSTKYQSSSSSMDYAWILVQKFRESLNIWVLLFWSFALYCLHCYLLMLFKCHFFQNLFFPFEIGHILFCLIRFHIICLYYLPFGLKLSSAVEIVDTHTSIFSLMVNIVCNENANNQLVVSARIDSIRCKNVRNHSSTKMFF